MTERDYLLLTDLQGIRCALDCLRGVSPSPRTADIVAMLTLVADELTREVRQALDGL